MPVIVKFGKICGCVASGLRGLFIISFCVVFQTIEANGQVYGRANFRDYSKMTTVDTGSMRVLYAFNAEDINAHETYEDLHRLEIGAYVSKYYSDFLFRNDSLRTEWGKQNPNAEGSPFRVLNLGFLMHMNWSEYYFSNLLKDFSQGILTQFTLMTRPVPNYRYSENIPTQYWEILTDTLTVAGYLCQKAICRYRGRDFVAWFAPDIPINNGPWKFGGLPGLILKIYDTEKHYVFECIQIRQQIFSITKDDPQLFSEISRENFRRAVARIYDGTSNPLTPVPVVWNPIELE